MLGNYEEPDVPSLQILLVGQTEFEETLKREAMRPLKQRIGLRFTLGPLAPTEVGEYMRHRWVSAGGTELPFTPEAVADVAYASRRIPRVINALCDNALLAAFKENSLRVLDRHVREGAAKLDLGEIPLREKAAEPEPMEQITVPKPKPSLWNRWASRHQSA
jgi:type II secretory pathway predicted ATPase ExeA